MSIRAIVAYMCNAFSTPSVKTQMRQELAKASLQLLESKTLAEYYKHMVSYDEGRVKRLTTDLAEMELLTKDNTV